MKADRWLNDAQIETFRQEGILVVPDVISQDLRDRIRKEFHEELMTFGVDHDDLENTAANLKKLSSTGGAGGILDLFYSKWRMEISENEKIFRIMCELWEATYAAQHPNFEHPFGPFDPNEGFIYVNRVCYRIPDSISRKDGSKPLQRSLTPHLDCCPTSLYDSGKKIPRWRPIQCFTALTPNLDPSTGGFEAVPGFHTKFHDYFSSTSFPTNSSTDPSKLRSPPVCIGDFSPLRTQEDKTLIDLFQHVAYDAGSVVFWDWKIPHANSYQHVGACPREVVYTGFLPNVAMNKIYAKEQLHRYKKGLLPADHWQKESQRSEISYVPHDFSPIGRKLFAMDDW